jgi:hypothetical protein
LARSKTDRNEEHHGDRRIFHQTVLGHLESLSPAGAQADT